MINTFITLIEPLELAGARALRIAIASAVLWGAIGLLVLAWWICKQFFNRGALLYPVVGDPNAQSLEENLIQGMQEYRDSPFVLAGSRPPLLILPMSVFHECHNMPNDCISIIAEHEDRFQGKYTHITTIRPEIPATIRQDLTRNMPNIILDFQNELAYASKQWPKTSNWTSVPLYEMMLRTVALLSGRAFVGLPLCRDQDWLQASIGYTVDCISIRDQLHTWSPILRPFIGPLLPSVRSVRRHLRFAARIMAPMISQVLQDGKQVQTDALPADQIECKGTFISWLLRHLPEGLRTPEQVGLDQMLVSFAAIHTTITQTAMALTKVVWELAKRPEYIEPLRAEMHHVLGSEADIRASRVGKDALYKLQKLDSFIKEVQRWCPSSFGKFRTRIRVDEVLTTCSSHSKQTRHEVNDTIKWYYVTERDFYRVSRSCNPVQFSLPHSVVPYSLSDSMSEKTPTFSPDFSSELVNPSPQIFDGFRYSNLRSIKGQESHHQAATTGPDYLVFNHGKHACPGRFFAIYSDITIVLSTSRLESPPLSQLASARSGTLAASDGMLCGKCLTIPWNREEWGDPPNGTSEDRRKINHHGTFAPGHMILFLTGLPTRLIDVGSEGESTVRWVNTAGLSGETRKFPYMILSYCWGSGNDTARTTSGNLEQRLTAIDLKTLPKTILDAIRITRLMKVQYIWVDAVCIIQRDMTLEKESQDYIAEIDWVTESRQMETYYANAFCCIAAANASDSSEGILNERKVARYGFTEWRNPANVFLPSPHTIRLPSRSFLLRRGWCLQEWLLSPRILHWTANGLVWQCSEGFFWEGQRGFLGEHIQQVYSFDDPDYRGTPRTNDCVIDLGLWRHNVYYKRQFFNILGTGKDEALGIGWITLVQQYDKMQLSFPIDRLAAAQAVASYLSDRHGDPYFAGIFRSHCVAHLFWDMGGDLPLTFDSENFPSWSWLSWTTSERWHINFKWLNPNDWHSYMEDLGEFPSLQDEKSLTYIANKELHFTIPLIPLNELAPEEVEWGYPARRKYEFKFGLESPIWQRQTCKIVLHYPEPVSLVDRAFLLVLRYIWEHAGPNSGFGLYQGLVVQKVKQGNKKKCARDSASGSLVLEKKGVIVAWLLTNLRLRAQPQEGGVSKTTPSPYRYAFLRNSSIKEYPYTVKVLTGHVMYVQTRREKNRQAQRVLKARRQQEVAEKDALISQLEATVDKLAVMHLDLIDEFFRSEALHQDTQFTQRLRDSIETTLHLVKGSGIEKKAADLDNNISIATNSPQLAPSPVLNIEAFSAGSAVEKIQQKRLPPGSLPNDQSFQTIFNTFGNGWTSDLPEPYFRFRASLGNNGSSTRDSLGLSIAEYTLYHAYVVLLHTVDPTETSVMQIFGFSLRKHSREELLFNLRWFLGPGFAHINKLAGITPHGADSPVENIPLLHPAVGADARSEVESLGSSPMSGLSHFMSANDVAVYLSSMKATSVDADVLELTVQDDYRVRISKPLFLEKLSDISLCLSRGPGFRAEYIPQVIVSSSIWSSR
ncbi:hypothetical protein FGADI_3580 [Fusarium gaditjirri]|uniref:Heterokaryon incompatibility domain-containing protein n=1 Tax=Fusarium gaditjirri TaxID=282569 RepID=A0A8H4TFA0_9HYPO|nr:hypothetical protein FGADI_3580 [Fusarium gaditjirri]